MNITRLNQAPEYIAPNHFDMQCLRLQGREAGPAVQLWMGLSILKPGGHTSLVDGAPLTYGKTRQATDCDFANPHFIAAARTAVPALIAEVERLRRLLSVMLRVLKHLGNSVVLRVGLSLGLVAVGLAASVFIVVSAPLVISPVVGGGIGPQPFRVLRKSHR